MSQNEQKQLENFRNESRDFFLLVSWLLLAVNFLLNLPWTFLDHDLSGGVVSVTKGGDGDGLVHYGSDKVFSLCVQGCEEVMEVVGWLLHGDKEASKVVDHDGVKGDAWFELVGTVDYRLELPEKLSRVHSTFHILKLKKCLADEPLAIPLDEIQVDDKLHFIEDPVEIMDREVKRLKQSRIPIVKDSSTPLDLSTIFAFTRPLRIFSEQRIAAIKGYKGGSGDEFE
ncbi:hypothetical protein Tco_0634624 [Tanacetum coccineum]